MMDKLRIQVRKNYKFLINNTSLEKYIDGLIQDGYFDTNDRELVKNETTTDHKNRKFLELLLKKNPKAMFVFMDELNEDNREDVVKRIKETKLEEDVSMDVGSTEAQVAIQKDQEQFLITGLDISQQTERREERPTLETSNTDAAEILYEIHDDEDKLPEIDRRIVLVGITGAGKSSLGNSILRAAGVQDRIFETAFTSESITSKCKGHRQKIFSKMYYLVDTPGIFDTRETMAETLLEIIKCMGLTSPGPHCFILAIRLDDKFTDYHVQAIRNIRLMFGSEIDDHMCIVYTRKDQLDRNRCTFNDYLQQATSQFKHVLRNCGNRYVLVDNHAEGSNLHVQTKAVLEMVDKLINTNGGKHFQSEITRSIEKTLRKVILKQSLIGLKSEIDIAAIVIEARENIANQKGKVWDKLVELLWSMYQKFLKKR